MGDASDFGDVERFMRSAEGEHQLELIRESLAGRRIVDVQHAAQSYGILTTLVLDNAQNAEVLIPSFDIGVLRERFEHVIEREREMDR